MAKHNLLRQSVECWEKTDFVRTPDSKAKARSDCLIVNLGAFKFCLVSLFGCCSQANELVFLHGKRRKGLECFAPNTDNKVCSSARSDKAVVASFDKNVYYSVLQLILNIVTALLLSQRGKFLSLRNKLYPYANLPYYFGTGLVAILI